MRFVIEMESEGHYQEQQGKDVQEDNRTLDERPIQFTVEEYCENQKHIPNFKVELDETSSYPHSYNTDFKNAKDESQDVQYYSSKLTPNLFDTSSSENDDLAIKELKVRLDKWLWAARFYKTRPLARAAVEKGFVFYDGLPTTPNREVEEGASLRIRQGRSDKIVLVKKLSTRRRSAQEASELYEETHHDMSHHDRNYTRVASPYRRPEFRQQQPRSVRYLRRSYHKKGSAFAQNGQEMPHFESEYEY